MIANNSDVSSGITLATRGLARLPAQEPTRFEPSHRPNPS